MQIILTGYSDKSLANVTVDLIDAPALTGSDKQVAWATAIRQKLVRDMVAKKLGDIKLADGRWVKNLSFLNNDCDVLIVKLNAAIASQGVGQLVAQKTQASWWINNRDIGYGMLGMRLAA